MMATNSDLSVLVLEDDSGWMELIVRDCKDKGWRVRAVDNVPDAISIIQSENISFDILIADKGGSNALRGGTDIIGHRDGLEVIRLMKQKQPGCIRALATGENWTPILFQDESLSLDIFMDKGWYAENADSMFEELERWHMTVKEKKPIVYDSESFSRKER